MQNDNDPTSGLFGLAALCAEERASYCTRSNLHAATAMGTESPAFSSPTPPRALTPWPAPGPVLNTGSNSEGEEESSGEDNTEEGPPCKRARQQEDDDPWNWWRYGRKLHSTTKVLCRYYRCAFIHPNGGRCAAKKSVIDDPRTGQRNVTYTQKHDHPAPAPDQNKRLDPVVDTQARERMKDPHASATRVEREFLLALPDGVAASRQNVPTRKQLHNKKHYQKRKRFGGGDAVQNILQHFVHEKQFVQEAGIIPFHYLIMAADDAIRQLAQHGRVLFVDGTFSLVEGRMVLTTIMVKVGQIGVPVAWLLSQSSTKEMYLHFFQYVSRLVSQITGRTLQVLAIMADYEEALRKAAHEAFPGAKVFGDTFHFMQANLRWMAKNISTANRRELAEYLRHVMAATTFHDCMDRQKAFLAHWLQAVPPYAEYFTSMWVETYPARLWAAFGRAGLAGIPTGSQILEGWHNRIQHHVWPKAHEDTDHAVAQLWDEWEHTRRLLLSPSLVAELAKEKENDTEQWRRTAAILPAGPPPAPTVAPLPSISKEGQSEQLIEGEEAQHTTSLAVFGEPAHGNISSNLAVANQTPLAMGMCPVCQLNKANTQCTLKACLRCCVRDVTTDCRVQKHQAGKENTWWRPLLLKLEELFALPPGERQPLYIKYMGGTHPGTVRAVTPSRWAAEPTSFFGLCDAENVEKKYLVARVAEWRDQHWRPSPD